MNTPVVIVHPNVLQLPISCIRLRAHETKSNVIELFQSEKSTSCTSRRTCYWMHVPLVVDQILLASLLIFATPILCPKEQSLAKPLLFHEASASRNGYRRLKVKGRQSHSICLNSSLTYQRSRCETADSILSLNLMTETLRHQGLR